VWSTLCAGFWGVLMMFETDMRQLPPFPLMFLSVSFLACLSAGAAVASVLGIRRRWLRLVTAPTVAAFVACAATRWTGAFPATTDGWESIFEPPAAALVATPVALLLAVAFEMRPRARR
jgi:hypothetical protein